MDEKKVSMDMIVFSICIICLISIFASMAYSINTSTNKIKEMSVENGYYYLDADTFQRERSCELYGMWEYYDGVHLISDNIKRPDEKELVYVPMALNMFDKDSWGKGGKASYRLVLDNLPQSQIMTFYLHGTPQVFKIYVNGVLQDSVGENNKIFARGGRINGGGGCEIIVEVTSQWLTGLYSCPWLYAEGDYESKVIFARDIWAAAIGGFLITLMFCIVFFRKIKERPFTVLFIRNVILLALFYEIVYFELSNGIQTMSEFIFLERLHVGITILGAFLVYSTIDILLKLFPDVFDHRIIKGLSFALYVLMILKTFIGAYVDMVAVIACVVAALLFYISVCTYEGIIRKLPGLVYVSAASILIGIAICMVMIVSSQRFFWWTYTILPAMFLLAVLCYCNYFAIEFAMIDKAAKREREASQKLIDAEIAYLTSQIQPHFQYNALTTIQELCYTDPKKAAQAITKYSSYLRKKVDFKNFSNTIPFIDELECINDYIEIQRLRFEDTIKFVMNIEYEDFRVPPLSVQTLVENAIHHGVRKRCGGGVVYVSARRYLNNVCIKVSDNGVGFDTESYSELSGQGISNSKYRIESLLNGELNVHSVVGEGTEIEIIIPMEE